MIFGTTIMRLRQEVLALKQVVQRSSATISTKSVDVTIPVKIESGGTGVTNLYIHNNSGTPMFFDVQFNFQTIKNTLGQYATPFYNHYAVDKNNPLNPMLAVGVIAVSGSSLIGQTFNLSATITATSDFVVEVL